MTDYAITFACYNQVEYTRLCVESLVRHGLDLQRLVVVDNASTDGTRDYLASLDLGGRILNRQNLGCGVAWNQGALALQAEWTVVMNNDVVVSAGWLDRLIAGAEARGLLMVSPAMIEGRMDYAFDDFAAETGQRMGEVVREGSRHAVCMCIHRSVWDKVGYFPPVPGLWGYEDTAFFRALDRAGIPTGILGSSWLHHFGSITVSALRQENGLAERARLSSPENLRLVRPPLIERKIGKMLERRRRRRWREDELHRFGMTLHGERKDGQFVWR